MSEKASIKVERRSTFDFDKDEEDENFYILISGKGTSGESIFLLWVWVRVLQKEQGARLMVCFEERSSPPHLLLAWIPMLSIARL